MLILEISWFILTETAIYILFGFTIAGLLQALISGERTTHWLRKRNPASVLLATLVGAPLSLCSCGVLPTALTLRRKGAGRGTTLAFLIATPEISATAILLTYSLLGPLMAVFRPIAAILTALTTGFIGFFIDRREAAADKDAGVGAEGDSERADCCGAASDAGATSESAGKKIADGMRFAFSTLFDDIFGWMAIGILATAAIQLFLPTAVFQEYFSNPWIAMPLMLLISIPLYVCAEASTPIAAMLLLQGLNPGAALVLLLAGPATNIGSIGVLLRELGRWTVIAYLASIATCSLLMGALLNLTLGVESLARNIYVFDEPLLPAWLKAAGAAAFLMMGLLTIRRRRWLSRCAAWLNDRLSVGVTEARLTGLLILLALGAYFGSGLFAVQPGEVGVVKRFGRIVREDLQPGLHYAWPPPFEAAERVPVRRVNRLLLGYPVQLNAAGEPILNEEQSWVLVGDENIAEIKCAVHWDARPGETLRFAYANDNVEQLVRNVTLGAMREVLGGRTINHGFTTERYDCERRIENLIQLRLDAYASGIRVAAFQFVDAHAPAEVHDSFRDVAGALEDKSTQINLALAQEARIVPLARGEGERLMTEAGGYAADALARAAGEAERFRMTWEAYRGSPRVTRRRLYLEMIERALSEIQTYIKPGGTHSEGVEIWLVDPQMGTGFPWQSGADQR